jgi:RimJ/RimL family protein N-acetyltransferase
MLLITERLLLRELLVHDWHAVWAYQSHPRFLRAAPEPPLRREQVQAWVQEYIGWQYEQPRCTFQLAMVLQTTQHVIGSCGIRRVTAHAPAAELGYELHPDYWGQGYATEAARSLLAFGFQTLGLQRVWAECLPENTGSIHVLERLGMRYTHRLHQHTVMQHRWWDLLVYAMDRAAWQAQSETAG